MSEVPPVPWRTIASMMRDVASAHAQREALVDGVVRLDFAGLYAEACRFAQALRRVGIRPGDAVAIWASNGWHWVVAASGIWQLGAIVVPMASRWKAAEVAPLLERIEARLLVVDEESAGERLLDGLVGQCGGPRPDRPIGGLPALERIVVLDASPAMGGAAAGGNASGGVSSWSEFVADVAGEGGGGGDPSPDGVAEILFTSGTTGAPKGVELSQRQLLAAYWDWSGIGGLRAGDRFLVIPPYSHGFGLNGGVLACWMRGVTNVPVAVFEPATALAAIEAERISVISGPPTLFSTLMNLPGFDPGRTRSLRTAFVGAAAVPSELIQAMRERMGIGRVINAYGLIEVCVVSMTRADDAEAIIATTTGRAMPGVEVRIVALDDGRVPRDVPDGESGEVWVRGQGVMRGYFRDPEQTASTIVGGGWCRTGDVGIRDAAGHIRVVDRLKDAYNCGGFSAYPAEIENQLLAHPEIGAASVVGVPDARLGEVGHAFVVRRPGSALDAGSLVAWARARMASYKVPRQIHFVDAFPLNANGKVRKDELKRRAVSAPTGR